MQAAPRLRLLSAGGPVALASAGLNVSTTHCSTQVASLRYTNLGTGAAGSKNAYDAVPTAIPPCLPSPKVTENSATGAHVSPLLPSTPTGSCGEVETRQAMLLFFFIIFLVPFFTDKAPMRLKYQYQDLYYVFQNYKINCFKN